MRQRPALLVSLGLAAGLAAGLACSHAETVAPPNAPNPPEAPSRLPSPKAVTPQTDPGHPYLAGSPSQLMAPGSADAIAAALRKRGLLAPDDNSSKAMEKALRTFQESQGLAATGFPDHETLRKLGIDPKKIDQTAALPDAGK
jgi:Putative peptidoglycan binding domain